MRKGQFAATCNDCPFARYAAYYYLVGIKGDHHADQHPGHTVTFHSPSGQWLGLSYRDPAEPPEEPPF